MLIAIASLEFDCSLFAGSLPFFVQSIRVDKSTEEHYDDAFWESLDGAPADAHRASVLLFSM
jgi:hypothetical protein